MKKSPFGRFFKRKAWHNDKQDKFVMPDPIRHPVFSWIPAFAGMTVWSLF